MVDAYPAAAVAALALGLQSAVAPCPMTANMVAMSFIASRAKRPRHVALAGILYVAGQALASVGLATLLVHAAFTGDQAALFLSRWLRSLLGPLLILVGMVLLGLLTVPWLGILAMPWACGSLGDRWQQRIERLGVLGPAALGIMFALSFCPTTAASFFVVLIPACVRHHDAVILPLLYALGAAVPVICLAFIVAYAAHKAGTASNALSRVERWLRRVTGVLFIAVGIYESLRQMLVS
jgi:cytochrome c biogenesis protein CcdA